MVRCFWQSKFIMGIMVALTCGVAAVVLLHEQETALYNPVVAALAVVGLGCISAVMLGNIVASKQCARVLRLLHTDLNPEAFLQQFEHVPEKLPKNTKNRAVANAYLADGYAAAGAFDKAVEALGTFYSLKGKDDPAYGGVYYCALCRYALFGGDMETADSAMESLDYVIFRQCGNKEGLKARMEQVQTLLKNQKNAIQGEPVDTKWLDDQLDRASYKIRELEILWVLALDALNREDQKAASRYLSRMQKKGGNTYFKKWAAEKSRQIAAT